MANQVLQQYIKLVEFLGEALGPDYEVALHDLTDKNRSIIAIANNHVSGREVGAPLTNVALKILVDRIYETSDYISHYRGISAGGKTLRSNTMFIKQGGRLIGMLCINFDDSRYQAVSGAVMRLCHPDSFVDLSASPPESVAIPQPFEGHDESFHNSIGAVAGDVVSRELTRLGVTADRLTADERISIISALDADGIFLLKGAVKDVAEALHCSQASVYRYLTQVKKE